MYNVTIYIRIKPNVILSTINYVDELVVLVVTVAVALGFS